MTALPNPASNASVGIRSAEGLAGPALVAGITTRWFAPPTEAMESARTRLRAYAGMNVASVGQVHGTEVAVVREAGHVPAHDGLVTDQRGLLLTVFAADCALVLFADLDVGVVGACHSGWRGTVAEVAPATVDAMRQLGGRPEHITAWISPCISVEAFEVGEEVAAQFPARSVERRPDWPRPHVSLRSELVAQLTEAGLCANRISASASCTVRESDDFYSYRAEGEAAGRIVGFVGLRA